MAKKNLDKFADVARAMTGSTISTDELFKTVNNMDKTTKENIYEKVDSLMKQINLPFDKAIQLVRKGLAEISNILKIDPAVIFQVYIEKRGE